MCLKKNVTLSWYFLVAHGLNLDLTLVTSPKCFLLPCFSYSVTTWACSPGCSVSSFIILLCSHSSLLHLQWCTSFILPQPVVRCFHYLSGESLELIPKAPTVPGTVPCRVNTAGTLVDFNPIISIVLFLSTLVPFLLSSAPPSVQNSSLFSFFYTFNEWLFTSFLG